MAEYILGDSLLSVNLVKESGESDALVEKVCLFILFLFVCSYELVCVHMSMCEYVYM